jgi:hypothetical protein
VQELLGRTFNRPRRETLAKGDAVRATFKNGLRDAGIKKLEKYVRGCGTQYTYCAVSMQRHAFVQTVQIV